MGVVGAPASGKSTLTREVVLNIHEQHVPAVVIPMDGYHYYKHELDAMPDSAAMHARRGAHWTFNVRAWRTGVMGDVFGVRGLLGKERLCVLVNSAQAFHSNPCSSRANSLFTTTRGQNSCKTCRRPRRRARVTSLPSTTTMATPSRGKYT